MKNTKDFSHEVVASIGNIYEHNGYSKEINVISWNGAKPVIDIRGWRVGKDGIKHPLKGMSLKKEEVPALIAVLQSIDLKSLEV